MMEEAPDLDIAITTVIDADFIHESLEKGKAHLRHRASYVFNKRKANPEVWQVGTWSKHVSHSSIRKSGTEEDKAQLPEATGRNKERQWAGRKRKISEDNRTRRRVPRVTQPPPAPPVPRVTQPPAPPVPTGELPDVPRPMSTEDEAFLETMINREENAAARARHYVDQDGNQISHTAEGRGSSLGLNAGDPGYRDWLEDNLEDNA
jgi:hypothetical protein